MSVTLTDDQFKELLRQLTMTQTSATPPPAAATVTGNFSKCSSRYDGSKTSDVNAFIDAVEVYKDCTHVSDENALKGLPMLFDGFAASWYQGVKPTLTTWKDATALLQTTFGPRKPPYRVYRELFVEEQLVTDNTDIFVCKCRTILAQLPTDTLNEQTQLDMVFGLLHPDIRKNTPRDKVKTFSELLTQARLVEETLITRQESNELGTKPNRERGENVNNKKPRCAYCKNPGHVNERKLASKQVNLSNEGVTQQQSPLLKPLQSASHAQSVSTNPTILTCYGCGTPGYIKTNCPRCSPSTSASALGFFSSDSTKEKESQVGSHRATLVPQPRPLLVVDILGVKGIGLIDTAAKQSIAGHTLYEILKEKD